jgi:hypothetical protein
MRIWNYNETAYLETGMKQVRILASTTDDQTGWTTANANPVFEGVIPQADGTANNPVNLVVNFGGRLAKYVLIASVVGSEHNWSSGAIGEDGISEVRFYPPSPLVAPTGFIGDTGSGWNTSSKVTVYAGSNSQGRNPSYTADGTGISSNGLTHDGTVWYGMYLSTTTDSPYPYIRNNTQWLRYDLDQVYELGQMQIWNYNESTQWWDGPSCGMKRVRIIASTTDTQAGYIAADANPVFDGNIPKATGTPFDTVNLTVDFAGIDARYILMYVPEEAGADKNWSDGAVAEVGLSEARFYTTPRSFIGDTGSGWNTSSLVGSSADSQNSYRESVQTVNGTGISGGGLTHDNVTPYNEMWLSDGTARRYAAYVNDGTHWIKYDMGATYNLDKMQIWNYNESNQWWDGPSCGMKQVRILASTTDDQTGWTAANSNPIFEGVIPKATGTDLNPVNLEVNFAGRQARYILITSAVGNNHNWSNGAYPNDGLAEVRFYAQKQAFSPSPGNEAISVSLTRDIGWSAGDGATTHDVYWGTSQTNVAAATRANTLSVLVSQNQGGTTYDTGTMSANTTYYWRIDECISGNVTTKGNVWKFTTGPGQATIVSPANGATGVSITNDLSWTAGSGATSHNVYFGTTSPGTYRGNQSGTTYDTGTMSNGTTYYWRIDEVGPGGTITGDVWSFTTIKAVPTFVAAGAVTSNTTAITPAIPAGIATNDILLLFLETANQAVTISNQNGGTWTVVTNSPQGTGTAGSTSATRLTVFWSRYNGTQGNPTTSDSGDHQAGRIIAIRGAAASGNPWDVTAGGVEAVSDTSASIPGATTTVGNTLVVTAIATALPDSTSTTNFSAWTNANLTSITERVDNARSSGNGGAIGITTGIRAATGVYGNTTNALATSAYKGMMSIAIKP